MVPRTRGTHQGPGGSNRDQGDPMHQWSPCRPSSRDQGDPVTGTRGIQQQGPGGPSNSNQGDRAAGTRGTKGQGGCRIEDEVGRGSRGRVVRLNIFYTEKKPISAFAPAKINKSPQSWETPLRRERVPPPSVQ